MFCEGFVVFLQRRIQRQEVATVSIRHDDRFCLRFWYSRLLQSSTLPPVATAFFTLKVAETGCTGSTDQTVLPSSSTLPEVGVAAQTFHSTFYVDTRRYEP